ncbi:MAG: molecular chaperone [Neisseriaceae bacterium]|nr:molecular chaperone [Neisseriaceae bacterium]MBP6861778.1 molecular chaperone [Neisseriaceae bacterium]
MRSFLSTVLTLSALGLSTAAMGSVQLMGTRIIYPAEAQSVPLRFISKDDYPSIMQLSVSTSETEATPANAAPFVVTPPIFRMEPHKDMMIARLSQVAGASLAQDRESVFYLSFNQIPAEKKAAAANNQLAFTFKTTVKLFYRPQALSKQNDQHLSQLTVDKQKLGQGLIHINNPTPYYVTINAIDVHNGQPIIKDKLPMLAPFSTQSYPLGKVKAPAANGSITLNIINDLGGITKQKINL